MDASLERVTAEHAPGPAKCTTGEFDHPQCAVLCRTSQFQGQLKAMPGKSQHQLAIQRQEHILQELYYFLLQKKLETSISSASTISNSKVVEPAIGGSCCPSSP
jgi:hypothetical protein